MSFGGLLDLPLQNMCLRQIPCGFRVLSAGKVDGVCTSQEPGSFEADTNHRTDVRWKPGILVISHTCRAYVNVKEAVVDSLAER